jgi:hypothetical protein
MQNLSIAENPTLSENDIHNDTDYDLIALKVEKKIPGQEDQGSDSDNAVALPTALVHFLKETTTVEITPTEGFKVPSYDKSNNVFTVQAKSSIYTFITHFFETSPGAYLLLTGIDGSQYKLTLVDIETLKVGPSEREDTGINTISFQWDEHTVISEIRAKTIMTQELKAVGLELVYYAELRDKLGQEINKYTVGFNILPDFSNFGLTSLKQIKDGPKKKVRVFFSQQFHRLNLLCHKCFLIDPTLARDHHVQVHLLCAGHTSLGQSGSTTTAHSKRSARDAFEHRLKSKMATADPFK